MLAFERDVKSRNMKFAKVVRRGAINSEGAFIRINTVSTKIENLSRNRNLLNSVL